MKPSHESYVTYCLEDMPSQTLIINGETREIYSKAVVLRCSNCRAALQAFQTDNMASVKISLSKKATSRVTVTCPQCGETVIVAYPLIDD